MAIYNVQMEDSSGNQYCPKPDLLTTKEQLSANTAAGKSVDALLVKELNNKLGNCSLVREGNDFYIVGADSVRKKLGSNTYECPERLTITSKEMGGGYLYPLLILTYGKNIKILCEQFDKSATYMYYIGLPAVNAGMSNESKSAFDACLRLDATLNPHVLTRNTDGLIVNSGKYPVIAVVYYISRKYTINNINIEWM